LQDGQAAGGQAAATAKNAAQEARILNNKVIT
jgi:hypothetical protein